MAHPASLIASISALRNAGGRVRSRGWRVISGLTLLSLLAGWSPLSIVNSLVAQDAAGPTEDQIKAAFLLNFPKYIEWPDAAFASASSPIGLTVIADRGVERELRRMAEGKLFNGHPLEVTSVAASEPVPSGCHILFIGIAEERKAAQIIATLDDRAILTVGECDDFFADGGVIKLKRRDRKIRLEINLRAAGATHLKISSKLLSVAETVKRREGE